MENATHRVLSHDVEYYLRNPTLVIAVASTVSFI